MRRRDFLKNIGLGAMAITVAPGGGDLCLRGLERFFCFRRDCEVSYPLTVRAGFSGNRAQFMAGAGVEALRRKGGDTGGHFRVYLHYYRIYNG